MEMVITLILRLISFGAVDRDETVKLLCRVRSITFAWIMQLRTQLHTTADAESSRNFSKQILWASVLCRSTFAVYLDHEHKMDSEALELYIKSSITMQDNLTLDPLLLPHMLKRAMMRDLKLVYSLRFQLQQSLQSYPASLSSSIDLVWPNREESAIRKLTQITFLPKPDQWWVEVTLDITGQTLQHHVHFHLLEGHFLVAGQPIGILPAEYRQHRLVTLLFGDRNLLAYLSNLPDMGYMLAGHIKGYEVHLGFRAGEMIVRARFGDTIIEFIPREKFSNAFSSDLPSDLLDNCTHWINITTKKIEVRQGPGEWKSRPGNWIIDFSTGETLRNEVRLVDPHSALFRSVASVFKNFREAAISHHCSASQRAVAGSVPPPTLTLFCKQTWSVTVSTTSFRD
jgi:hypothetical protein